jgi:hypothetical protein
MNRLQAVGEYLHFHNAVPQKLVEMGTIMAARQFAQQYEWDVHYPLALSAGLPAGINRRPPVVGLSAHCAIREPISVERPQPQFIAHSHRRRHPGVRRIRGAAPELGNSHRPGIDRRSDIAS